MSIFSVRFLVVVDEPVGMLVPFLCDAGTCRVVLVTVLAGVTVVVVLGALIPVIPVQSYSFGWIQPSARAFEADGHVTDPCSLGQH